jgi:GNAT superfamily N-acetyltransferase
VRGIDHQSKYRFEISAPGRQDNIPLSGAPSHLWRCPAFDLYLKRVVHSAKNNFYYGFQMMSRAKQHRMNELLIHNREAHLTSKEKRELEALVMEAQLLTIEKAKRILKKARKQYPHKNFHLPKPLVFTKPISKRKMKIKFERLTIDDADSVFDWVMRLLIELGDEGDELGSLDREKVLSQWQQTGDRFNAFVARNEDGKILGVLTLVEPFAIYANGNYGIVNEMYVSPEYRSSGVGELLIDAAKEFGRKKGWARIDVTAPESERWERSQRFYEKQGFVFTWPKLKFLLN